MGQVPTIGLPEGLLDLMHALEAEWPARTAALRSSGVPLNEDPPVDPPVDPPADPPVDPPVDPDAGLDGDALKAALKAARDDAAKHRIAAREATKKVKEYEDKDKTEQQKLEERAAEAEKQASASTLELVRLRVALKKGLTEQQAKRLLGNTEEDLEKDADELLASFKPSEQDSQRTPRERLRPGAAPGSEPEETDPAKLAALVPRRY